MEKCIIFATENKLKITHGQLGTMCKYKDTNLGIKKLVFGLKRGMMAVYLTDGRVVMVPVSMFPEIKKLSIPQRENYMIMDDQYFSFDAMSKIYSIKDVLRC